MKTERVRKAKFAMRLAICGWLAAVWVGVLAPVLAHAGPTLQDISKSFDTKLSQKPDSLNLTAIVIGIIAVVCILAIASQWGNRQEKPKAVNHSGRLLREMRRKIHLSSPQIKRLKILSERKGCASPLTLVLCPSLLSLSPKRPAGDDGGAASGSAKS